MFTDRLQYEVTKFVDRKEEIEDVLKIAHRLNEGLPAENRIVIFRGQRGSGKTWLLRHLEHTLREGGLIACYIPMTEESAHVDTFRDRIPADRPLALLLDDVNNVGDDALDELTDAVLSPLAQDGDVLIVLTERGRPHYWNSVAFREKSRIVELSRFKSDDLKELIFKQSPDARSWSDEIENLSGGYPWAAYLLGKHLPDDKQGALKHCVNALLTDVSDDVRTYFEALCVLKAFDETRIRYVLGAHPSFDGRDLNFRVCREVREKLVATTMVRWNDEARGYTMDEPLRLLLSAYLRERDCELWKRLHETVYRLYNEWAGKYEQSRDFWSREAEYHQKQQKEGCSSEQVNQSV